MDDDLPIVAQGLLRRDPQCGARVARTLQGLKGGDPLPNARYAVEQRVRGDAKLAHTEMRIPTAAHFPSPNELRAEQVAHYRAAALGYLELFGDQPAITIDMGRAQRSFPAHGIRFAAGIGLAVRTADDRLELRKLAARSRPPQIDDASRFAVALLAPAWNDGAPVRLVAADLLALEVDETTIDCTALAADAEAWLEARIAVLRASAESERAVIGNECLTCSHIWNCPAHQGRR